MENKKEGYTEVVIPEQRFNSCEGCKYYENKLIKSGYDPVYWKNCNHPDIIGEEYFRALFQRWTSGNLGNDAKTPDWCPFLNK